MAKRKTKKPPGAPPAPVQAKETLAEKIVFWCLHALVFAVPLAISNVSWLGTQGTQLPLTFDQFDIVKVVTMRALTLIAAGAFTWAILTRGGKVRLSGFEWAILAFLGWVVLTTLLSVHPPTAVFGKYRRFEGLISFVNYAAVFFLALQAVDRPGKMISLAKTLVVSGTIVSFYGLLQYLGIDPITWGNLPFETNRGFATYGNPDLLGGYLIFPLAISFGMIFQHRDSVQRTAYWSAFLIITAAWVTAFVRGAWIGGSVALIILVGALIVTRIGVRTSSTGATKEPLLQTVDWVFIGTIAAIVAFIFVRSLYAPSAVLNIWERLLSIFRFKEGSALTRFEIWEAAWRAITDGPRHFIFGHGADTFRLLFPKYKPIEYTRDAGYISVADNVHNYPLQLSTALGVPGFLILYGIFGWIMVKSFMQTLPVFRQGKGEERMLYVGFWAAAVGYLVHLTFGLSVTGSTIFLWLSLALLASPLAEARDVKPPVWGMPAAAVVALLLAVAFAGNIVYVVADHHYLIARVASDDPDSRIARAERAIKLNPFNDMYRSELGLAHEDRFVRIVSTEGVTEEARGAFADAEDAFSSAIEFTPPEYDNYVFVTNLYNQGAAYLKDPALAQKAVEYGERGVKVEPYGPAIRLQLSLAYASLDQYDKAIGHLEYAARMDPRYVEPRIALGDVYRRMGRLEDARNVYLKANELFPDSALAQEALRALEASMTTETP